MPPGKLKVQPSAEYTNLQMVALVEKFIAKEGVCISNSDDFEYNSGNSERYYFIEVRPGLKETRWIFMYHDKTDNRLYLFDPEGLPLDKVNTRWFHPTALGETSLFFCHSWFVYSKHKSDVENFNTGVICLEIADYVSKGLLHAESIEIIDNKKLSGHRGWKNKKTIHFNLMDLDDAEEDMHILFNHLESYPEVNRTKRHWEQSELVALRAKQSSRLSPVPVPVPVLVTILKEVQQSSDLTDENIKIILDSVSPDQSLQLGQNAPAITRMLTLLETLLLIELADLVPQQLERDRLQQELRSFSQLLGLTELQIDHVIAVATTEQIEVLLVYITQVKCARNLIDAILLSHQQKVTSAAPVANEDVSVPPLQTRKRRFYSFFEDDLEHERTGLQHALLAQRDCLHLTVDDVDLIEQTALPQERDQMFALCFQLIWSREPGDADQQLRQIISDVLAKASQGIAAVGLEKYCY